MLFVLLQRLLPKHLISRLIGRLANSEVYWIKQSFIRFIMAAYPIDLAEAERQQPQDYRSFNDFFTRTLKAGVRPVSGQFSSPADGKVAALGRITDGTLIQSKKHNYSLSTLLGERQPDDFANGSFITIYLAPHNYHRVHVPATALLHQATYIPGALFSVNETTAQHLPNLFAKNERLVCRFRSELGPYAAVLVGAMIVAGIKPAWLDQAYKPGVHIRTEMKQAMRQGAELGQFEMGSTVILLLPGQVEFSVKVGDEVQMGQPLVR